MLLRHLWTEHCIKLLNIAWLALRHAFTKMVLWFVDVDAQTAKTFAHPIRNESIPANCSGNQLNVTHVIHSVLRLFCVNYSSVHWNQSANKQVETVLNNWFPMCLFGKSLNCYKAISQLPEVPARRKSHPLSIPSHGVVCSHLNRVVLWSHWMTRLLASRHLLLLDLSKENEAMITGRSRMGVGGGPSQVECGWFWLGPSTQLDLGEETMEGGEAGRGGESTIPPKSEGILSLRQRGTHQMQQVLCLLPASPWAHHICSSTAVHQWYLLPVTLSGPRSQPPAHVHQILLVPQCST